MMTMPNAIPDDGLLDVTVIKKVSIFKFAANVKNVYDGSFIKKIDEVKTFRGKKIHIVSIPPHSFPKPSTWSFQRRQFKNQSKKSIASRKKTIKQINN